jgi:hypothetical protein
MDRLIVAFRDVVDESNKRDIIFETYFPNAFFISLYSLLAFILICYTDRGIQPRSYVKP